MALLGLSDRPKSVRRSIQNTLGLHIDWWVVPFVAHTDPWLPVLGKNTMLGLDNPWRPWRWAAGKLNMDPRAGSLVQKMRVQPGMRKFHMRPLG